MRAGPSFECTPSTWIEELELPRLPALGNGLPVVYTLEVFSPLKTLHFAAGGCSRPGASHH